MDHQQFLTTVAQLADDDMDAAEHASEIVLTVLGQHLTRGEAADVARRLPAELQAYAWSPGSPQRFPPEEFLRRVAGREGVDLLTAERNARAVFTALRDASYTGAATPASSPAGWGPVEFARRVERRADISLQDAAHRIPAVFTVQRPLVGDEFFDIAVQLPDCYRPLLGAAQQLTRRRHAPANPSE